MSQVSKKPSLFIAGRVNNRAGLRRLREKYLGIAQGLDRQPQAFADISADKDMTTRISYARPVMHALEAMAAAKNDGQKSSVLEGVTRYAMEIVAIVRAELPPPTLSLREIVAKAQRADAEEEMAESAYLADPTAGNLDRWRDALRSQLITSNELDICLCAEANRKTHRPPIRMA